MKLRTRCSPNMPSSSNSLEVVDESEEVKREIGGDIISIKQEEPTTPPPIVITVKVKKRKTKGRPTSHKSTICETCGKVFKDSSYLINHRRRHLEEALKPHKCTLCDRGFSGGGDLSQHIKAHLKERPYNCTICNKTFTRTSLLSYHMRIHTGERPYNCDQCGMTFARPFGLDQHKKSQHVDDNLKPFKCKPCNKYFISVHTLQDHVRANHTNERKFACTLCDRRYPSRNSLRLHTRTIHHKDMPLATCPKPGCSKMYNSMDMSTHIRKKHPSEALFKCPLCSMAFVMKGQLNQHMRSSKSHVKTLPTT